MVFTTTGSNVTKHFFPYAATHTKKSIKQMTSAEMNHQAVDETRDPPQCIGVVSRSRLSPEAQEALHRCESTESLDMVDGESATKSQAVSKQVLSSNGSMDSEKSPSCRASLTICSNIDDKDLADEFRSMVIVKDRKWRLKTYRNCFVGSEAVDMLISSGHAKTREEAVLLGRRLGQVEGLFEHVCADHPFIDGYLFYQFNKQSREQGSFATAVSRTPEGSDHDSVSEEISAECQKVADTAANAIIQTLWTVPVKDRRYRLKSYPQCFVGSDAVSLLVSSGHAASREEAVLIGRVLCHRYNLFHHVQQEHLLEDKYLFYRFSAKSQKKLKYSISPDTVSETYRFSRIDKDAVDGLWESLFRMVECKDRLYQLRTYKNVSVHG
jgi:hypothetical protein